MLHEAQRSVFQQYSNLSSPGTTNPANPFSGLSLTRPVKLWWNGRQLDGLLGDEVDKKVAARADDGTSTNSGKSTKAARKRSIVDLALDQYQKDLQATGKKISATTMPPSVRVDIIDSLKTFIFAGHDTTASTTSYIFYQLHCHPQAQARVVSELNAVLGSNPADAADVLKSDPHCINKLDYTTAVIKEVLRLHPPASTMRMVPLNGPKFYFTDPDQPGKQFPLNGFHIWPPAIWTHRNEEFFPEPTKFVPERFLQNETPYKEAKLFTPAGKDAFRPFEKGPRHCTLPSTQTPFPFFPPSQPPLTTSFPIPSRHRPTPCHARASNHLRLISAQLRLRRRVRRHPDPRGARLRER